MRDLLFLDQHVFQKIQGNHYWMSDFPNLFHAEFVYTFEFLVVRREDTSVVKCKIFLLNYDALKNTGYILRYFKQIVLFDTFFTITNNHFPGKFFG